MRQGRLVAALLALSVPLARTASADDASDFVDAATRDAAPPDADAAPTAQAGEAGFVTACGGALCDTTTGSECDVDRRAVGGRAPWFAGSGGAVAAILLTAAARRRRRGASRLPGPRRWAKNAPPAPDLDHVMHSRSRA